MLKTVTSIPEVPIYEASPGRKERGRVPENYIQRAPLRALYQSQFFKAVKAGKESEMTMKIRRNITMQDIMDMCVKYRFYLNASPDEYYWMPRNYNGFLTDDMLEKMAVDIVEHSDITSLENAFGHGMPADDMGYYCTEMAGLIANKYCTTVAFY